MACPGSWSCFVLVQNPVEVFPPGPIFFISDHTYTITFAKLKFIGNMHELIFFLENVGELRFFALRRREGTRTLTKRTQHTNTKNKTKTQFSKNFTLLYKRLHSRQTRPDQALACGYCSPSGTKARRWETPLGHPQQ